MSKGRNTALIVGVLVAVAYAFGAYTGRVTAQPMIDELPVTTFLAAVQDESLYHGGAELDHFVIEPVTQED